MIHTLQNKENKPNIKILKSNKGMGAETGRYIVKGIQFHQDTSSSLQMSVEEINIENLKKEIQRLHLQRQNERKIASEATKHKQTLENQLTVAKIQIRTIYSQNQKLKLQLKQTHQKFQHLQQQKLEWMERYYQLNNSINFDKAKFQVLENNQKTIQKQNQILKAAAEKQKEQNLSIYKEVQKLQAILKQKDKEIKTLQSGLQKRDNDHKQLKRQIEVKNRRIKQTQTQRVQTNDSQQQLKQTIATLQKHNQSLQQKIQQLLRQISATNEHLPTQEREEPLPDLNEFRIRLVIKQKHIDRLNRHIKTIQEENQILKIENSMLQSKKYQGSIFSPKIYNRYNMIGKEINKVKSIENQNLNLSIDLEAKEQEIQKYVSEKQSMLKQIQHLNVQSMKYASELKKNQLQHEKQQNSMKFKLNQLEREVEKLRKSDGCWRKEIEEKDRIIMKYIGK